MPALMSDNAAFHRYRSGDKRTLKKLIDRYNNLEYNFKDDDLTTLRQYAFYKHSRLTGIDLPSIATVPDRACEYCIYLDSLNIPSATRINIYAFQYCKSLNDINTDSVVILESDALEYSGVGKLEFPLLTSATGMYIAGGDRLSVLDYTNLSTIAANAFNRSYSLCHLILRKSSVCTLANVSAFTNTAIANGIGWIYVPEDLVDEYKGASNWSTYASQIVSIEEYPKPLQDETITDTWDDIIAACNNGTYSTAYNLGDIKYLNIGDTQVAMEIVAFDSDETESGETSHITFLSHGSFDIWRMNPTATTEGGWKDCELRSLLRNSVFGQIDPSVQSAILPVVKTYTTYENKSYVTDNSTIDTIWIPSYREVYSTSSSGTESSGATYTGYFTDAASRTKKSGRSSSNDTWWLRSAYTSVNFRYINISGTSGSASANGVNGIFGVVIGFCI